MRARLKDERLCDLLIPNDYGFGTHRVPLEMNYLEAYLRPNVEVVSVKDNPIARVTETGIETEDGTEHELDVIILATGFDAGTGALTRIDIRGRDGRSLTEEWGKDIRTTMGLQAHGYPNMFTHGRTARSFRGALQHDHLPTAADRMDHRLHQAYAGAGQIRDRADRGDRGGLGQASRGDLGRHPDLQDGLLVSGLERAGQAATRSLLLRRGRHLSEEMRRSRRKRL